jgi:Holliday junction resolvase RusA-like endonuclease
VERDVSALAVVPWSVRLCILGAPRTKKNSNRLVPARGRQFVLPSAAFERYRNEALPQLVDAAAPTLRQPVNCRALVYRDANRGDLIGYLQGLADLLEEADVVENDRLIVGWDGSRMFVDRERPRVEIVLTPAEEDAP